LSESGGRNRFPRRTFWFTQERKLTCTRVKGHRTKCTIGGTLKIERVTGEHFGKVRKELTLTTLFS